VSGLSSTPSAHATNPFAEQRSVEKVGRSRRYDARPIAYAAPSAPHAQQEVAAATTPLGLWHTDDGNVRVEQCGANLCAYGEKDGRENNELVLINMEPSADNNKWTGRIHNPNSFALKDSDAVRVQGCLLGGALCGGTTGSVSADYSVRSANRARWWSHLALSCLESANADNRMNWPTSPRRSIHIGISDLV
jgi:uncharacterized protein (DUF2147 family)